MNWNSISVDRRAGETPPGLIRRGLSRLARGAGRRFGAAAAALALGAFSGAGPAAAQSAPSPEPILRIAGEQHTAPVRAVAVSPDGALVASTGDDKTIRIWRASDGAPIETVRIPIGEGDEGILYSLAFAPSGRSLLAAGISGVEWEGRNFIYVIRPSTGEIRARIPVSGVVNRIVYGSAGGETRIGIALAARQGGAVQIRDARGAIVFEDINLEGQPAWIDFAPNGDLIVAETGGRLRIYDAVNFSQRIHTLPADRPAVARPSPDGEMVAIGYYNRRAVDVLRLADFRQVSSLAGEVIGGQPHLNAVAWTPGAATPALWAGGAFADPEGSTIVRRWRDVRAGDAYDDIPVSEDALTALEAMPDGSVVYAASDPGWGVIGDDMELRHAARRQGPDFRLVYDRLFAASPDGAQIAFNFEQRGEIGDLVYAPGAGRAVQIRTDADRKAIEDWHRPTPPAGLENWRVQSNPVFNGVKLRLALRERSLSADAFGDGVVIGGDRGVYVFGADGRATARLTLNAAAYGVLALSPERFAAALGDGTIRWFRVRDGEIEEDGAFFLARTGLRWLAWLPDGRFDHSENGGQELAGYHVNRSSKEAADWVEFSQLYRSRYAPDIVRRALLGETPPPLETETAELAAPKVELIEFCPEVDGARGECAEAQLAKRGFSPIADAGGQTPASTEGDAAQARLVPAEADAVILRFRVTGGVGGLSKIDIFLNQRSTGAATRGLGAIADPAASADADAAADAPAEIIIERRASLRDGLNRMQVRVYDSRGTYGVSDELELYRPAIGEAERPDLHVLVVGANAYSGVFSALRFARPDAEGVASTFRSAPPSLYGDLHVDELLDEEVTDDAIEAALARIAERVGEEDGVVVYFAGHGVSLGDGLYSFVTPEVATQADIETKSLDQQRLAAGLGAINARNVLLMLDTCYAGAYSDKAAGTLNNETGLMVLTASSSVEEALDGYGEGRGVFAHALQQALTGGAAGPTGIVDAASLGTYVRDLVPVLAAERNHGQRPQLFVARSSAPFPLTEPGT